MCSWKSASSLSEKIEISQLRNQLYAASSCNCNRIRNFRFQREVERHSKHPRPSLLLLQLLLRLLLLLPTWDQKKVGQLGQMDHSVACHFGQGEWWYKAERGGAGPKREPNWPQAAPLLLLLVLMLLLLPLSWLDRLRVDRRFAKDYMFSYSLQTWSRQDFILKIHDISCCPPVKNEKNYMFSYIFLHFVFHYHMIFAHHKFTRGEGHHGSSWLLLLALLAPFLAPLGSSQLPPPGPPGPFWLLLGPPAPSWLPPSSKHTGNGVRKAQPTVNTQEPECVQPHQFSKRSGNRVRTAKPAVNTQEIEFVQSN